MKFIKQAKLFYQEGNSDKVYEVDICYVGGDRYVVDFRYGRRGATLKSGSKTASPVVLAQAEKIFNDLVNSKLKEGYQYVGGPPAPAQPATSSAGAVDHENPFAKAVLTRLAKAKDRNPWPINRAIWRAGELKIKEAIPLITPLLTANKDWLRDYCAVWALGSIGDPSTYLTIKQYADHSGAQPQVKRIAKYAMLMAADSATREQLLTNFTRALPAQIAGLAESGTAEQFRDELRSYLTPGHSDRYAVLEKLYLIDSPIVRPAILTLIKEVPLKQNTFQPLRYIFKAAELRRDAEVYGLLAYRFETERANPGYSYSRNPFVNSSRDFFRRRQWHTIEHLGHLGDPDYVKMAVGLLLQYKDSDAKHTGGQGYSAEWGKFSDYYIFNHILYGGSSRYSTPAQNSRKRVVAWGYAAYRDQTEPTAREESFPQVWDKRPQGFLHLLVESECHPVHKFAVKGLKKHTAILNELDLEVLTQLLAKPYEVTAKFAFELVWSKIKPLSPDVALLGAIANCSYQHGRREAHNLISQNAMLFLNEGAFLAGLVFSKHADTRAFVRQFLKSTTVTNEAEEQLIAKTLSYVLTAPPDANIIESVSKTLQECFIKKLQNLNRSVVLDLLQHPSAHVQELGGNILLLQDRRPDEGELIYALLRSEFEIMRGIGVKLLGQLPDEALLQQEGLLVSLCSHTLLSVRNMSRPLIKRLTSTNEALKKSMAAKLIELLLSKEHPTVHDHLISLLMDEFSSIVPTLSGELALRLTRAKSVPVQEFGGYLLSTYPEWGDELDTKDIAKLASHELRIVREACFAIFRHIIPRLRKSQEEMGYACKLLEATWQDSRELGFTLFEQTFTHEELTPQILVSICDSPRADVRAFGQKMISRYFDEAHGEEYLLKLSEHPSSDLQSFATNYLEQFAKDNTEKLKTLSHYFLCILSRVNKGRIAKQRVMQFLAQEGLKSEASALLVVELLNRVSATISVQDRARAIEAMVSLKRKFPAVPVLLQVQKTKESTTAQMSPSNR